MNLLLAVTLVHFSTHHDSISKDSISKGSVESPVFKQHLGIRVMEDYSEVANCAPPLKTRNKSSSSRKKSSSDSVKETSEETTVTVVSYYSSVTDIIGCLYAILSLLEGLCIHTQVTAFMQCI